MLPPNRCSATVSGTVRPQTSSRGTFLYCRALQGLTMEALLRSPSLARTMQAARKTWYHACFAGNSIGSVFTHSQSRALLTERSGGILQSPKTMEAGISRLDEGLRKRKQRKHQLAFVSDLVSQVRKESLSKNRGSSIPISRFNGSYLFVKAFLSLFKAF